MDFLAMCDAAMCAPDYAVTRGFRPGSDEDIDWLHQRLAREGHAIPREDVAVAIKAWGTREHGVGHHVGSIRL